MILCTLALELLKHFQLMLYSLLSRGAQTLASCARGFAFVFATKWRFFCWGWNYPSAYFPLSSRRSSERLIAAVKAWGQPNLFLKMLRSSYKCYGKSSLLAKICYQRPSKISLKKDCQRLNHRQWWKMCKVFFFTKFCLIKDRASTSSNGDVP